eukprot:TRINITY_DN1846_c0_g2_i2.p2 TRINITY_DN1846_c0_g2~~TRINITY_DN1846_c0_g2_i2.p2  ORF type:complete len:285 (+),score=101.95 TRINITY_DN1846_c0_g2_i2:109-963(+)
MRKATLFLVLLLVATVKCSLNVTQDFNWDASLGERYLFYSFSSYCPQARLMEWNCLWCVGDTAGFEVKSYSVDPATNTACMVGINNQTQTIVIAFKGTDPLSLKNWITDFDVFKADTPFDGLPDAYVHGGFLAAWKSHKAIVFSTIQQLVVQNPNFAVVVTGHSLGGAQAILCILDLVHNERFSNIVAYTYGSPRVGDPAFASYFNQIVPVHYRVTHSHDIVPHVPLIQMNFHHPGREVWETNGNYIVCDGSGEDGTCSDSNFTDLSIPDHLTYMDHIFVGCYI